MGPLTLLLSVLLATIVPVFFIGHTARFLCALVGSNVKSKTASRKQLFLDRAAKEEAEASRKDATSQSQLDGEWEKIENSTPSSTNGDKETKSWEGVIGFFHPFW